MAPKLAPKLEIELVLNSQVDLMRIICGSFADHMRMIGDGIGYSMDHPYAIWNRSNWIYGVMLSFGGVPFLATSLDVRSLWFRSYSA
jgi:hypothetical protein